MAAAIQLENLDFLCETMSLIGEFYLLAHDVKNAVYSFHHLVIFFTILYIITIENLIF